MNLELTEKQFRRLLDLVYVGNWILNATRGEHRFKDYDEVESLLFLRAMMSGMPTLGEMQEGEIIPSRAFVEGGIHEAIMDYEGSVFFEILAEDLARRDMEAEHIPQDDIAELAYRMENYISEFEAHGTNNISITSDNL